VIKIRQRVRAGSPGWQEEIGMTTTQLETPPKKPLIVAAGILVVLMIIGFFYFTRDVKETRPPAVVAKKPMTLLLIGMDINVGEPKPEETPALTRTDTLILAILDPVAKKASLVSIPRDSLVNIPGHGLGRINEASVLGGIPLTRRMVTRLTGCRIDHYMQVGFESFQQLVDLVGGIEVNVDKKMRYADEYGVYKIKLDPGPQVLDGVKALQYVRFRHEPLGDIGRVERQRKLLLALYTKLKQPLNIVKIPSMLGIARKYMRTDLKTGQMLELIQFARKLNPETDIRSYTLPGSFYEAYWKPDRAKVRELMAELKPQRPVRAAPVLSQK
jgi:LCP family protein required for cell wall assembly